MGLGDFLFKEKEEKYLKQIENLKNIILTSIKICISSIIATCAAYYINNTILKLVVFSAVFLLQWAYPIFKYRERVFYKK